jgi:hypothetical protein
VQLIDEFGLVIAGEGRVCHCDDLLLWIIVVETGQESTRTAVSYHYLVGIVDLLDIGIESKLVGMCGDDLSPS